jgi:predicted dehydrogenase
VSHTEVVSNDPVRIGVIGAGDISNEYIGNLNRYPDVKVLAVGNRDTTRAAAQAEKYGVPESGDIDSIVGNADVELILNLTIPAVHVEISTAALEAGKHVWSEKPIGIDRASVKQLLEIADERGLLVGVAPDTVLGPMWQTAKRALAAGAIGTPQSALTSFQSQGPEFFHPNPSFLYARGAGPLFDLGPYYLSALVHLLGPITQVLAVGSRASNTRKALSGPHAGAEFPVEVPTHLSVVSRFEGGQSASSLMSSDTARWRHGIVEINGTEGTMVIGNPDHFTGPGLQIYRRFIERPENMDFTQVPERIEEVGVKYGRGVGALTMARTIRGQNQHIATGEVAYHVLDAMASIEESTERERFVDLTSTVSPIPALAADFDPYARTV